MYKEDNISITWIRKENHDDIKRNGCLYYSDLAFNQEMTQRKHNSIFLISVSWDERPSYIKQSTKYYGIVTKWSLNDKCGVKNAKPSDLKNIQNHRFLKVINQQFNQLQEFLKKGLDVWIPTLQSMAHHNFFQNDEIKSLVCHQMFTNLEDWSQKVIECYQKPKKLDSGGVLYELDTFPTPKELNQFLLNKNQPLILIRIFFFIF